MTNEELQAALATEREARIRAEATLQGYRMAVAEMRSGGTPVDSVAERRREYDRNRKRKGREIPVDSGGIPADVTPPTPPLDGSPLPPAPSLPSPLSSPHPLFLSAPPEASPQASGEELPDVTHHAEEVPNAVAAFVAQAPLLPEADATPPEKPAPKGPDPEALRALWNRLAPPKGLARWEAMNKARTAAAKASLLEVPDLGKWEAWLTHELDRPFNRGDNPSGWRADVDWLLRAKTRGLVADFDPATAAKPAPTGDRPRLGPPAAPPRVSGDRPRI